MKKILSALVAIIFMCTLLFSCAYNTEMPKITAKGWEIRGDTFIKTVYNAARVSPLSEISFSYGNAKLYSADGEKLLSLDLSYGENTAYIVLKYNNTEQKYKVTVIKKEVTAISVSENYKRLYRPGESLDRASVTVTAALADGTSEIINDYSASASFFEDGESTVIFTCGECKTGLNVTVLSSAPAVLDGNNTDASGAVFSVSDGRAVLSDGENVISKLYYIPENIISDGVSYPVTEITDDAFYENISVQNVYIGKNIKKLGQRAFFGCSALEGVSGELPLDIGSFAFAECASLEGITLPEEMTLIPDGLFSGCGSLYFFSIPYNCEKIGLHAFLGCDSFTRIELPQTVSYIGKRAFDGCASLEYIFCGAALTFVGEKAFASLPSLKCAVLPSCETEDGETLFEGCPDNAVLYTPDNSSVGYYAVRAKMNVSYFKENSIFVLDPVSAYYINDEISQEDLSVMLFKDGYLGVCPSYGLEYNFGTAGQRNVTVRCDGLSCSYKVFVSYVEYLTGRFDFRGAEYLLNDLDMTASLSSLPEYLHLGSVCKEGEYIMPTSVISGGSEYTVCGIEEGAVRGNTHIERLLCTDSVIYIGDNAICDAPLLKTVLIPTPVGTKLDIGNGNFEGCSEDLCVLCTTDNSVMYSYALTHKLRYGGTDTGRIYLSAGWDAKTEYEVSEEFEKENYRAFYLDSDFNSALIDINEVSFEYDFSQSGGAFVKASYNGYTAYYKVYVR